jgi:hypothetical protein
MNGPTQQAKARIKNENPKFLTRMHGLDRITRPAWIRLAFLTIPLFVIW